MADTTKGNQVEAWAIEALRAAATLPFDLQINPQQSSDAAQAERLVVTCAIGESTWEGEIKPGGQPGQDHFEAVLTFDFHSINRSAEQANDVFAKTEAALCSPVASAYVDAHFFDLVIFDEKARTTNETRGNFRIFTRTIPLRVGFL